MKQINFSAEFHEFNEEKKTFEYKGPDFIGTFELLWNGVDHSPCQNLTKKDHKVIKRLKKKLREISVYKDSDEDARVLSSGSHILLLEGDEYEVLKKLLDANIFSAMVSDEVDTMYDLVDNAPEYQPPKPALVKDDNLAGLG
jgi:hypothetical protein